MLDLWIGNGIATDIGGAMPNKRLHRSLLTNAWEMAKLQRSTTLVTGKTS
jgi:hypothetical protein